VSGSDLTCDFVGENGIEHLSLFLLLVHAHVSGMYITTGAVNWRMRMEKSGSASAVSSNARRECLSQLLSLATAAEITPLSAGEQQYGALLACISASI